MHNAVTDMGQGNSAAFVQMAGHILGQDASLVKLRQPDTTTAYPSGSSSAGRTTYTFGNALIKACEELKARLINRAGLLLFMDNDAEPATWFPARWSIRRAAGRRRSASWPLSCPMRTGSASASSWPRSARMCRIPPTASS